MTHVVHHPQKELPAGNKILAIVGPTASGKTEVSIEVARRLNGEIISADSRQIYRHLDIGTAKPSADERKLIRHHFVDTLLPDEEFNAGKFGLEGRRVIGEIIARGKIPVVVGGSGLYVRSLIDGLFEGPGADREYRARLELQIKKEGIERLLQELRRVDPVAASKLDRTKIPRIVRALEVYHLTGVPLSELHTLNKPDVLFSPSFFGLRWDRPMLYDRINRRCEEMISGGLLDEVDRLERMGYGQGLGALKTVGYAEAFAYRRGRISFEEMVRLFKQNSRRYAKRQLTWFGRDGRVQWIHVTADRPLENVAAEIAGKFEHERSPAR